MDDDVIDALISAIQNAAANGEGELYRSYVRDALKTSNLYVCFCDKSKGTANDNQ